MKKSKLIMSIATLCLAIAVLCFGVYAVQTVNYSLSGNITYEVTDAFVEVQTKLYKSTSYLTSAQLGQKVNEIAESNFTTAPAGLTLVDTSALANSTSGTLTPYSKTDLSFSTQAGSECYAYFFVTNIKNMSSEQNVWAVMEDNLTSPTNTVQINNGLQQTIDTAGKNMVIGVGLDNPGNSIPADTSAFSYGIKIGVGDLATQDFNLAKLDINGSTVKANRSNMNGVVVIPDKNPTTGDAITTLNGNSYPNSSTTAGFANTNFTTIAMADNIQTIGNYDVFANNQLLTNIILSKNLTSIGYAAFEGCSKLSSITIPNDVATISNDAFKECTNLKEVTFVNNSKITKINSNTFWGCSSLTSITIPNSVTTIDGQSFMYCTSLTAIEIPSGVSTLYGYSFSNCSGLESITVAEGNTTYKSEGNCIIEIASNTLVLGCKTSNIPSSVTSIESSAFGGCTGLTSIEIPSSVTIINGWAFSGCTGLTDVTILNGVTSIGESTFSGCTNLTTITIPSSVTSLVNSIFRGCNALRSITVDASNTAYKSEGNCVIEKSSNTLLFGCNNSTIPSGVTSIGSSAFYNCTDLTSITIPSTVETIESSAFDGCTNLTTITIPNSVTSIKSGAFKGCTALHYIDEETGLKYIKNTSSDGTVDKYFALYDIVDANQNTYTINENCKFILSGAFSYCRKLNSITIPSSVTSISSSAFYNCTGLTSITIPSSVAIMGSSVFESWTSSQTIKVSFQEGNTPEGWDADWYKDSQARIEYAAA